MDRLIFHIDVNSAYLSWEAARRTAQGEVDLRTIPAAIGGDRESRTGVILAKSIPAKQYGVETGEPIARALKNVRTLCWRVPTFDYMRPIHARSWISAVRMRRLWKNFQLMNAFST